jgi:ketosteroid isomerase-like protein
MNDPVQSFSAMLRDTLGERLKPGVETFVQMFAEDGVMEFPYALPTPRRVEGREALVAHLNFLAGRIEFLNVSDVVKHQTGDPDVCIIEFAGFGRSVATGEPFEQRYISVIRVTATSPITEITGTPLRFFGQCEAANLLNRWPPAEQP